MPVVDVTIGKRTFQLSCEEGQENRLKGLAGSISERIKEIAVFADSSNDTVLLAMAALMAIGMVKELDNFLADDPLGRMLQDDELLKYKRKGTE